VWTSLSWVLTELNMVFCISATKPIGRRWRGARLLLFSQNEQGVRFRHRRRLKIPLLTTHRGRHPIHHLIDLAGPLRMSVDLPRIEPFWRNPYLSKKVLP